MCQMQLLPIVCTNIFDNQSKIGDISRYPIFIQILTFADLMKWQVSSSINLGTGETVLYHIKCWKPHFLCNVKCCKPCLLYLVKCCKPRFLYPVQILHVCPNHCTFIVWRSYAMCGHVNQIQTMFEA